MSKKPFRPQNLELRYKTYFAVLTVPKDVQYILGKKRFFKTTGTGDIKVAQAKSELFVIKWKSEIANARLKVDDPDIKSALELNQMLKASNKDSFHRSQILDVIEKETDRLKDETHELMSETFNQISLGKSKMLKAYVLEWEKNQRENKLQEKSIAQMKSDLNHLFETLPSTNLITNEYCDLWIKNHAQTESLSASSVTRIIAACRNFYKFLQEVGVFQEHSVNPFKVPTAFKKSKRPNAKLKNRIDSWIAFSKNELESIYEASLENDDDELSKLIKICSYTGARIEEICSLKVDHIDLSISTITIADAKSKAGNRVVPIHPKIKSLITKMTMESSNKFLFNSLTENKYKDRSNAIGKRFGRLKKKLGYGKQHVFHSIRKTFTTELERNDVPESITADIVGHEKQTMTYGLYSAGSSLEQKRKAIIKVRFAF